MSTNKSEHLNLHLWEPEDDFLRMEFNENFEKIDQLGVHVAECSYVIGTYTGTGTDMEAGGQLVELGFRPRFLLISRGWRYALSLPSTLIVVGESMTEGIGSFLQFEDNGFRVANGGERELQLDYEGIPFSYVAFR